MPARTHSISGLRSRVLKLTFLTWLAPMGFRHPQGQGSQTSRGSPQFMGSETRRGPHLGTHKQDMVHPHWGSPPFWGSQTKGAHP